MCKKHMSNNSVEAGEEGAVMEGRGGWAGVVWVLWGHHASVIF